MKRLLMKIMIDTNILVDYLAGRGDEIDAVNDIFHLSELGCIDCYVSALSICDTTYILRKFMNPEKTNRWINTVNNVFNIIDLLDSDLIEATNLKYSEFEDAVLCTQDKKVEANYFITHNLKHFKDYQINAISPSSFIKMIESEA